MYYQEQQIHGVLHYRNTPTGFWKPKSAEHLSGDIANLKIDVVNLKIEADELRKKNIELIKELSVSKVQLELVGNKVVNLHAHALVALSPASKYIVLH